jgi:hypothetical protein
VIEAAHSLRTRRFSSHAFYDAFSLVAVPTPLRASDVASRHEEASKARAVETTVLFYRVRVRAHRRTHEDVAASRDDCC